MTLKVEVPIQELKGTIRVIDYILVNEAMYKHDSMEIHEDRLLYDISDHVYIYVILLYQMVSQSLKIEK